MANASDLLDEYLVSYDEDLAKYKKLPKRQIIELIELILRRYAWLREHDAELPDAHVARLKLAKLLPILHATKKLPCTEADLRMMLDLHTPLLDFISADRPVDHVMEYVKEHDLTPELCQSLHEFQANIGKVTCSAASLQSIRQRLFTLLFMDEWDPLKLSQCWSESIRRDFRAMTGERKANWRRLLKHIRGNVHAPLGSAWAREASERLAAVGIDDFNEQLAVWFAPFRSGEPLPLSVTGSHVLKGLVLYVAISGDETAKQTAMWLLDVKWKQKRNIEKAMSALQVLGVSRQELLERNLIPQPSPVKSLPAMEHILESLGWSQKVIQHYMDPDHHQSPEVGETLLEELLRPDNPNPLLRQVAEAMKPWTSTDVVVDHDEGVIMVQGQQQFYRLTLSSGKIERVRDNAELELNWEAIPDHMRMTLHRDDHSPEQLNLLAELLRHDSIYGPYFRVKQKS